MAYMTDPNTIVTPHVRVHATAAVLNNWKASQDFLHDTSTAAGAEAYRTTNQTITGTQTINWTAEGWDVGTVHDNVTNNDRLTVPTGADGLVFACLEVRCTNANQSWPEFTIRIRKNATTTLAKKTRRTGGDTAAAGVVLACSCSWLGPLAAADYLTGTVINGSAVDAVSARCALSMTWVCRGVV